MFFVDKVFRLKINGIEKVKREIIVFMDMNGLLILEKLVVIIEIKISDILIGVGIIIVIVLCVFVV